MTNEPMDLDLLDIDEEFLEWEKSQNAGITYPALSVWRGKVAGYKHRDGCFSISVKAQPYFTAEAYRYRVSENYIIFVPSTKKDPKAYWLRKYFDISKQFTTCSLCIPNLMTDIEPGIHKLLKCKQGLCIRRKADKEEEPNET